MNVSLPTAARLALCGFVALLTTSAYGQTFRPLAGYEALAEPTKRQPVDKMDCSEFDATGFIVLAPAGENRTVVRPDTSQLGPGPFTYACENCDDAEFGTARVSNDTLIYGADAGAVGGTDAVRVVACNAAGGCGEATVVRYLVRRADRDVTLAPQTLAAREELTLQLPPAASPVGQQRCRTLAGCAEDYAGRSQSFAFVNDANDVVYRASGVRGQDVVCVTVCGDFGICDTYRFPINVTVPAVDLPFFDDFAYRGVRPDRLLWQDEDVLINRNFGVDPPSIGVATFDGVDFSGQPYPQGSGGRSTEVRDYLTSAPLRMAGLGNVNLSFYVQPRGLGNRPEAQDSFLVQFLTPGGEWRTVYGQAGLPTTFGNAQDTAFASVILPVTAPFYYDGFQFRFGAKSSEQGAVDMWHVDYVKLGESLTPVTQDVALTEPPGYLLREPYTAMPMRHLRAGGQALLAETFTASLRNHFTGPLTIAAESQLGVETSILFDVNPVQQDFTTAFDNLAGNNSNDVPGLSAVSQTIAFAELDADNQNQFVNYFLDNAPAEEPFSASLFYDLTINGQSNTFAGGALQLNDFAATPTRFDEYLAYDDGSAEVVIEGSRDLVIVQGYEAFVDDILTGISVRLPRPIRPLDEQDFRLVVYAGTADGAPGDELAAFDFPVLYPENFNADSLQGFTTYVFEEPVPLPAGPFYVGWEQQRAERNIGVGFDRNRAPVGVQFFSDGSGFQPITGTTTGAIMLRPLLAGFGGFTTSTEAPGPAADVLVDVFPNPTTGPLHLRPRPLAHSLTLDYRLLSATGQLLRTQTGGRQVSLTDLPAGLYILEARAGQRVSRHRIVRR